MLSTNIYFILWNFDNFILIIFKVIVYNIQTSKVYYLSEPVSILCKINILQYGITVDNNKHLVQLLIVYLPKTTFLMIMSCVL